MGERWGINIDVEGFSSNYEFSEDRKTYAICALGELMSAIYRVGTECYPGTPEKNFSERIFAHQFGDGFLICPDFDDPDTSRVIALAVALLRHMALKGYAAKAALAVGDLSGINGCYPQPMSDAAHGSVDMGMGFMTTIGVMGTALTRAHKLGSKVSGAVLAVEERLLKRGVPDGALVCGPERNRIDWVSSNIPLANEIAQKAGLSCADPAQIHAKLQSYCATEPVPPQKWVEATFMCVSCAGA